MPLGLGPFPKECLSLEPGKLNKDFAGGFYSKRIFPGVGSIPSSSLALPLILVSDFATFNKQDSLLRVSALILLTLISQSSAGGAVLLFICSR